MAYQNFKKRDISYLNKDFSDFRAQLINYSQTYFPQTYTDFTPSSPGMMIIEQASYVGDVLSFYIDNQVQETFTQYARQTNNIYQLAYMFGYKPKVTGLAEAEISLYQLIPSKLSASAYIPDYSYTLRIPENTQIKSNGDESIVFSILDSVDFSVSSSSDPTEITVAQVSSGNPQYYLLKKKANSVSGAISTTNFTFGSPTAFPTKTLQGTNIAGIVDVFDADGNQYYEVDYLGQDMIYENIKNTNTNDPQNYSSDDAPYILKLKSVQRRFNTRFVNSGSLLIQFGSGNNQNVDENIVPNSMNVGLGLPFQKDKLTTAFSPTNFIFTNTYGIAPSNTTLTVRYLTGGGVKSNVNSNSLTNITTTNVSFVNSNLNATTAQYIFNSLQSNNEAAASGGNNGDGIEEIRQNTLANISTQLRNVTADDYLVRALSMPPTFGIVSKAYAAKPRPNDNTNSTLCIYVLTSNINGQLVNASTGLKNNLKTYLNQYRMIGDSLDIKDAYVININVLFEIITLPDYNSNEVISQCISNLQEYFNIDNFSINQPIIIKEVEQVITEVAGVQTIKSLNIGNVAGTSSGYSQYGYDVVGATQNGTIFPSQDPSIFEVKYPATDIVGRVVNI